MRNILFPLVMTGLIVASCVAVRPAQAAGYVNCTKFANDVAGAYAAKHTLGIHLTDLPVTFVLLVAERLPAVLKDSGVRNGIKAACEQVQE